MRMGLEAEGWSVAMANDIDLDKKAIYRTHFNDAEDHFLLGDIHELQAKSIPAATMATASFPCNDLSLAGMRSGLGGKQSSAFWGFTRVLEEMGDRRPPIVLLENVAGFLTSNKGKDIEQALLALNRLGYSVDALVIDAQNFVPQSRVRLFVVGSLRPGASFLGNETAAFYQSAVRPKPLADFVFEHPEIDWNIRPIPEPPQSSTRLRDIIENPAEDSDLWWSAERTDYLISQMSERHSAVLAEMRKNDDFCYGTVFRRVRNRKSMAELRSDGIAGCLRTPRGGSGRQILVRAGMGRVRARLLTPRECARLMGADDFRIETSLNKALFGFGDAVCVPVISWLARNYLNPLAERAGGSGPVLEGPGEGLPQPERRAAGAFGPVDEGVEGFGLAEEGAVLPPDLVMHPEAGAGEIADLGGDPDAVVEPGRRAVAAADFQNGDADPFRLLQFAVGATEPVEHFDPGAFEPRDEPAVVDEAHRVGLGVAHADSGLRPDHHTLPRAGVSSP